MSNSNVATAEKPAMQVVDVNFSKDAVPEPQTDIVTTDDGGQAPRHSRRIAFVDDGKLFEGHLTVQSRSLKLLIQFLVHRLEEQTIAMQDMQEQISALRTQVNSSDGVRHRLAGAGRSSLGSGGASRDRVGSPNGGGLESIERRLRPLEQFMTLWGVQSQEVAELVQTYGDPVITPDEYTAYLLDLAPFRLARREARALQASPTNRASLSTPPGAHHGESGALTSPARRSQTRAGNANAAGASATTSQAAAGNVTARALEVAQEALTKVQKLSDSALATRAMREELDDLTDFVRQKFGEVDGRLAGVAPPGPTASLALRAAASHERSRGSHSTLPARDTAGQGRDSTRTTTTRSSVTPATNKDAAAMELRRPSTEGHGGGAMAGQDVIDGQAREDATAALELIMDLEQTMNRRFKEYGASIANLSLRVMQSGTTATGNKGGEEGRSNATRRGHSNTSGNGEEAGGGDLADGGGDGVAGHATSGGGGKGRRRGDNAATGGTSSRSASGFHSRGAGHGTSTASSMASSVNSLGVGGGGGNAGAGGAAIDRVAREEVSGLAERLADFEADLARRWQAVEDRMRALTRASMTRNVTHAVASAIDRKARDDAALSLTRLQHLEREMHALRRALQASTLGYLAAGSATAAAAEAEDASLLLGLESTSSTTSLGRGANANATTASLHDIYTSKVQVLEKEVQQRMNEVHQAMSLLRGEGHGEVNNGGGGNIAALPQRMSRPADVTSVAADTRTTAVAAAAAAPQGTNGADDGDALHAAEVWLQRTAAHADSRPFITPPPAALKSLTSVVAAPETAAPTAATLQPSTIVLSSHEAVAPASQLSAPVTTTTTARNETMSQQQQQMMIAQQNMRDAAAIASSPAAAVFSSRDAPPPPLPSSQQQQHMPASRASQAERIAQGGARSNLSPRELTSYIQPTVTRNRAVTVHRLRSPNAATFGSNLVQQVALTEAELAALMQAAEASAKAASSTAEGVDVNGVGQSLAATTTTTESVRETMNSEVKAAGGGVQPETTTIAAAGASAGLTSNAQQTSSAVVHGGGVVAEATAPDSPYTAAAASVAQDEHFASLGHGTPCVVLNCTWCATGEH